MTEEVELQQQVESVQTLVEPEPDILETSHMAEEATSKDEDEELNQLEEELGNKEIEVNKDEPENDADKAARLEKLERMKLLRKRKKENKQAKKLAAQPEEIHLKAILEALQTSFDGKEFEVLMRVLQPKINDLKANFYRVRSDLQDALLRYYPVVDIKVFGSCVTDMAFNGSDFDFYLNVPGNEDYPSKLSRVHRLICNSKEFFRPIKIPKARTPLIKCMHVDTKIKCDINVSNSLGVFNSEFLRWALTFDPRIKPLAICIKYYTRVHFLGGVNQISSYCITLMIILYLQIKKDPVFPPIYMLQERVPPYWVGHCNMAFDENFYNTTRNRETIAELLEGFFEFYSNVVFEDVILCPYIGRIYPRAVVNDNAMPEFEGYRYMVKHGKTPINIDLPMCVQDPFEQNINCASPVSGAVLKRFKDYCAYALKLCQEFPNHTYRTSFLLKKLFTESPPTLAPKSLLELTSSNRQVCKLLPIRLELEIVNRYCQKNVYGTTKRIVQKYWGELAFEYVLKFFTDILLMKFFPFEIKRYQRERFVLADYQLRIRADTWTSRDKIEFNDEMDLSREIELSNELKQKNPPLNLDAELTVLSTRERDFIEVELVSVAKKDVDQLRIFFENTVQKHIRNVLKGYFTLLVAKEELQFIDVKENVVSEEPKGEETTTGNENGSSIEQAQKSEVPTEETPAIEEKKSESD